MLVVTYQLDSWRYFHHRLPDLDVIGWKDLPDALGITYWSSAGQPVAIAIDRPLRDYSHVIAGCVLLHEEAHIMAGLKHGHDKRFRKLMLRAIKRGGCEGLL